MRAIPATRLCSAAPVGCVLVGCVLAGCVHERPRPVASDVDGVRCQDGATQAQPRVYIDLDYAAGTTVEPCTVDAGTAITWRAPAGSRYGFALDFVDASPEGPRAPLHYESSDRGGQPKVSFAAGNEPGSYEYHYSVGGRVVDPVIIIRR